MAGYPRGMNKHRLVWPPLLLMLRRMNRVNQLISDAENFWAPSINHFHPFSASRSMADLLMSQIIDVLSCLE